MNACFCRPANRAARPGRLGVFPYARFSTSVSHKCSCENTDFPSGFALAAREKSRTARYSEPAGSVWRG